MNMSKGLIIERDEGFSLLEVMIALTILAIGLLGLAIFQSTAISANKSGNQFAQASFISQQRVEALRTIPFDSITTSPGITGTTPDTSTFGSLPPSQKDSYQGVDFLSVWYVNNATADLKEITLWVYWQDKLGLYHNVQIGGKRAR